jgi:hypothetical protein
VIIAVDLASGEVRLESAEDCGRFHVSARGGGGGRDVARLGAVLGDAGLGRVEGEDAFVTVDAVRRLAGGRVGDGWEADFAAMLDYARVKGWLDAAGTAVQAHVRWA